MFYQNIIILFECIFRISQLRERLISLDRNNQRNLDLIETSLFALVLDENEPSTETEVRVIIIYILGDYNSYMYSMSEIFNLMVLKLGVKLWRQGESID